MQKLLLQCFHLMSSLSWHTPLGQKVVLVIVLDADIAHEEEECDGWVHHDVSVEILMCLVQHSTVVACVHVVPPSILCWVDVVLWHAKHAHLLEVPVALQP